MEHHHNRCCPHNWRRGRNQIQSKPTLSPSGAPVTLLDLSAKVVAQHIPFQSIEQRYDHIPEQVQRRVIFWSFPRHEDDIKLYSSLSSDASSQGGPLSSTTAPKTISAQTQPPANQAFVWDVTQSNNTSSTNCTQTNNNNNNKINQKQITFHKGLRLYEDRCVQNVLQVGFNLSGQVNVRVSQPITTPSNPRLRGNANVNNYQATNQNNDMLVVQQHQHQQQQHHQHHQQQQVGQQQISIDVVAPPSTETFTMKNYRVSVTFDRCKIISVSCSCNFQDIFWCEHVVALILLRIRNPETVDLRVPISETLLSLDRQQLQKLVQYIIAEHHTEVLPTAQRLLDQMGHSLSAINQTHGAPDPTAGACADDEHIWHLDEQQVNEKVQNYLNLVSTNNSASKDAHKQMNALFEKVREMFRAKDSNGTRLLKLITEQFLRHATRNEKSRSLWDQLVFLWVVVMLNPDLPKSCKATFILVVDSWSRASKCPKEDVDRRVNFKRRATEDSSDDDDYVDCSPNAYCNEYPVTFGQSSNNYPAHMATHRRIFLASNGFPPARPYNQLALPTASTCPCQLSHTNKKLRTSAPSNINEQSSSSRPRQQAAQANEHHHHNSNNRSVNQPSNENRPVVPQEPRSIFHIVLDFQSTSWDDSHLQLILNKDGPINFEPNKSNLVDFAGNPLWSEPLSQSAARIETLRSFGYKEQALRLTVATVRRLKLHQDQWYLAAGQDSEVSKHLNRLHVYEEGWIGHPFDPINVMVDMLLNASMTEPSNSDTMNSTSINFCGFNTSKCSCPYNQALMDFTNRLLPDLASLSYQPRFDSLSIPSWINMSTRRATNPSNQATVDKSHYFHVPVPGCCQKDSYLTLAVELALIALGQQRSIPTIATAHDRAVRQESKLISKLESIDTSDSVLIDILKHQATLLLEGGPFQNSCCGVLADSAPLHTFARYLFDSLVPHYSQLAYKIGVYALKMPLSADDTNENHAAARTPPQNHLRTEQLALAQTMFSRAKEEKQYESFLKKVHRASVKNIRNPNNLLKLSKHVLKEANSCITSVHQSIQRALLQTAFDLGLQVLKITLAPHSSNSKARREAIQFIVDCATDIGLDSVLQVMKTAREHFSAVEALNLIVNRDGDCINLRCRAISKLKLKENSSDEARLTRRSKELALDCAARDPPSCALEAIKFCEVDEDFLKRGLKIVIEAGASESISSGQLIEVADYVHNLGMADKAFEIALVAVDIVSIPVNSDNTSSRKSITSACEYASKVNGFSILIPKLIKNINCATLLSDIYHKFNPGLNVLGPYRDFANGVMAYRNSLTYGNEYGDVMSSLGPELYKQMSDESRWWAALLKHTMKTFVDITRSRLQNISPRHYGEFIDFLAKAQGTFDKAPDGPEQFKNLIAEIIKAYRTKKKLMERLKERFDLSYITGKV